MNLSSPISELKGVGADMSRRLNSLGIKSIAELIENYPRRYEDYSQITPIKSLKPGQVTIEAKINNATGRYVRRGMHITEAIATDGTDNLRLIWFNQPYRAGAIKVDQEYYIAGEFALRRGRFSIANPSVELKSDFPINTARIIPIYKETKGLKSFGMRKLIRQAITDVNKLNEHLPKWLIDELKLMDFDKAVRQMHFPISIKSLQEARRRLGFEEVFELSLAALINKYEFTKESALAVPFNQKLAKEFVAKLPFKLTDSQRKVAWQIYQDLKRTTPMNRLIEGDVGSGKTVVAAMAAIMAMEQGFQVAIMAPTEILARQHAATLHNLLGNVNMADKVGLLIGGLSTKQKQIAHRAINNGEIGLIVGTHALISEKVDMHKLGLIIIDEQHRFGVGQRKKLQAKAGHMPHVLHMTATPIPRSLALTLYGELDISILDDMPPGRQPIQTKICPPNAQSTVDRQIDEQIEQGRQVYVVCPVISSASALFNLEPDDSANTKNYSVEEVFERLSKHDFKHRRVELLHGKMKSEEKEKIMNKFVNHEIDILVSTTVIEVGVDVPNASVLLIEGAERFGLAQIHQLRGRVGRGPHQSYCFLMTSTSQPASARLRAIETTTDGFKLAELDLRLRGPGAIYGTLQHGALDLRIADFANIKLIAAARSAAQKFIDKKEKLAKYPYLEQRVNYLRAITNLN